jgi:hypothetical protein
MFLSGPRGVPLFGNLFQVGSRMNWVLRDWGKIYGNIFSIQLGLERYELPFYQFAINELMIWT